MVRLKAILLSFLCFSQLAWAQRAPLYQINKNDSVALNAAETNSLSLFFAEIESLLPSKMRAAFSEPISVKFQELREHLQGKARKGEGITLNKNLISVIHTTFSPDLRALQEAKGTVLHETAHLYDFMNLHSQAVKSFVSDCRMAGRGNDSRSHHCEVLETLRTTVSTDPRYLEVAGWPISASGENYRKKENVLAFRSVDGIELKNYYEHFATNFEHYILDQEYSCRKPLLSRYFDGHFGEKRSRDCSSSLYVNPSASHVNQIVQQIPLSRVYQIQLLHAGPGSQLMSNWGHSMFRVVICAPDRVAVNEECLKDENHHLVLSFRAFVNTPSINSWSGLRGKYPSRLFFIPFDEVKKNYLDIEGRDLFSFPLNLNQENVEKFIQRALEIHWSYDSRYYFLSSNCAVESLNLVRSLNLNFDLLTEKTITPNGLIGILERNKIIERPQGSSQALLEKGFLHQNRVPFQIFALQLLTKQKENEKSLKEFYRLSFQDRYKVYQVANPTLEQKAARLALEEVALEHYKTKIFESLLSQAFEMTLKEAKEIVASYMRSVEFFNVFSAPHEFIRNPRYGIPSQSELQQELENIQAVWNDRKNNDRQRREMLNSLMGSERRQEIESSEAFINEARESLFE